MALRNVKHVNMNGKIEQEGKQRKKVTLDFDKVTVRSIGVIGESNRTSIILFFSVWSL